MPVLESYLGNAKVIEASERLTEVIVHALGSGTVDEQTSSSIIGEWEESAGIKRKRKRQKISEYGPEMMGAMGIGVHINRETKEVKRHGRDDLIPLGVKKEK